LDELRAIDRNMGKAGTIAKDITMKSDVATARASVQEIINKHQALLRGQLADKFKIKPQTSAPALPAAKRTRLLPAHP
jgi:hypothetical protein